MKVWLPFFRRGSGLDFWTHSLSSEINRRPGGLRSFVSEFPGVFFNAPVLVSPVARRSARSVDLVHLNSWDGLLFNRYPKPVITVTVHRPPLQAKNAGALVIRRRERRVFAAAAQTAGVSRFVCDRVAADYGIEPLCIHNGVNTRLFKPAVPREKVFTREDAQRIRKGAGEEFFHVLSSHTGAKLLFAGNLTMRKGADLLDQLAERLDRRFLLVCAGDRGGGRLFRRRKRIIACGMLPQPALASIFRSCHIFLFPVREEGFGLVLAEAMASGLPVIASLTGPVPEILSGEGGFLLTSRDATEWEEAVNSMASEPGAAELCGIVNRARIEKKFDLRRMAREYSEMFEKSIEKKRDPDQSKKK